jgi:hypothetical protein
MSGQEDYGELQEWLDAVPTTLILDVNQVLVPISPEPVINPPSPAAIRETPEPVPALAPSPAPASAAEPTIVKKHPARKAVSKMPLTKTPATKTSIAKKPIAKKATKKMANAIEEFRKERSKLQSRRFRAKRKADLEALIQYTHTLEVQNEVLKGEIQGLKSQLAKLMAFYKTHHAALH